MATNNQPTEQPVSAATPVEAPAAAPRPSRLLSGTQFLTLEHSARMIISVILPLLVLAGLATSFSLWASSNDAVSVVSSFVAGAIAQTAALANIGLATALLVLTAMFWLLDKRVRRELAVRPGYHLRLGYKLPIYSAFFLTAGLLVFGVIDLVSVLIGSLVLIGSGADIGGMYLTHFLPVLLGMAVVGFAAWYQYKLLRGVGKSSLYGLVMGVVAVVVALTIIITTAVTAHQSSTPDTDTRSRDYNNLFDNLEQYR